MPFLDDLYFRLWFTLKFNNARNSSEKRFTLIKFLRNLTYHWIILIV